MDGLGIRQGCSWLRQCQGAGDRLPLLRDPSAQPRQTTQGGPFSGDGLVDIKHEGFHEEAASIREPRASLMRAGKIKQTITIMMTNRSKIHGAFSEKNEEPRLRRGPASFRAGLDV